MVHVGDEVAFTITVSVPWTADVWMNGTVTDPALGWSDSFFDLMPGESASWTLYYTALEEDAPVFENTAYVTAWDQQCHTLHDDASAYVEIIIPSIDVTKSGPEYAAVGQTITYTVTVTNTGNTVLYYVEVYDTLLMTVVASYDELAPLESHTFTYDYTVPAGDGTVENTAIASGYDVLGRLVWDDASWTVVKYATVTGFKFADLDRDGIMSDEPGIMNWIVTLEGVPFDGSPFPVQTVYTDTNGWFSFTMLKPGNYVLSEYVPAGWNHYTPASYAFSVGSGSALSYDFGNLPYGSISGYKWHDDDLDGIWDDDELGILDWGISLHGTDANGDPVELYTTTDASGYYEFTFLLPGDYTVSEEIRDGWYATTLTSMVVDVSALAPFEVTDVDFGNAALGEINGYKWLDEFMNGIWDWNEPAIEGWTIELTGTLANGEPFGPIYTLTDANGFYQFGDLMPGVYVVREVIPEGWTHITPDRWEATIEEGDLVFCAKFGNVELGSIDGWKFLDWDMDELKDGPEYGLEGWAITLEGWLNNGIPPWSYAGTYVGPITVYTDENGYWEFPDLLPGVYKVTEESRAGWHNTTPLSRTIIIGSGTDVFDVKFGNVPYTCIWGYKFNDLNGDGQWGPGEPAIEGWPIFVDGVDNNGTAVHIALLTDSDGMYATCYNLLPGTYVVSEGLSLDWEPTTASAYRIALEMTDENKDYRFDFGNFELGQISGYKYEDMDGSRTLSLGDTPISGWQIDLYLGARVGGDDLHRRDWALRVQRPLGRPVLGGRGHAARLGAELRDLARCPDTVWLRHRRAGVPEPAPRHNRRVQVRGHERQRRVGRGRARHPRLADIPAVQRSSRPVRHIHGRDRALSVHGPVAG